MTSELRPAALVAHEVCEEMEEYGPTFAKRVIKADREAVRAEQAAELAKWRDKYNELGQMALEQVSDLGTKLGRLDVELDAAKADLQAANRELAKWKEQRLLDHGRLLWREDVETHCPNADLCFEYSATVRCSPCAIKQSDAEGVEALSLNGVYQPEVARLNRELAKFKALAETLAGALGEIAQPDFSYTGILYKDCWRERTAREALTSYKEARDAS